MSYVAQNAYFGKLAFIPKDRDFPEPADLLTEQEVARTRHSIASDPVRG